MDASTISKSKSSELIRQCGLDVHADKREPLIRDAMDDYGRRNLQAIRVCHTEDQLRGAREEFQGFNGLALQDADAFLAMPVGNRMRQGENWVAQAKLGLSMLEWRMKRLREGVTRAV